MRVYRLERNGWGVFCTSDSGLEQNYPDDSMYQLFGFQCDRRYHWVKDYRSGCSSIDKLIEYFGSDFSNMIDKGASIVEYNVNKAHVRTGLNPDIDIEVAFNINKIKHRTIILEGTNDE